MLRALVEAKHSGLQTRSSFREKVWAEARRAVDSVVINGNLAPLITAAQMSYKWGDWKSGRQIMRLTLVPAVSKDIRQVERKTAPAESLAIRVLILVYSRLLLMP
ncbi:hypothetical protein GcM3_033038 [Golovinomyces cichoracearum]|uniref:Uncharacterized protein n=1 Tax=Golovinomyces cichoracearum TaxID=62708 RepID=A0A420J4B1_9PEZI|nr:hypothetical protein GcM3_033038 [Golovinomyces cichoracearum]